MAIMRRPPRTRPAIAVYCGSNRGTDPAFAVAAVSLGRLLAERGIRLVYGGGHVGLMGVIADAVLAVWTPVRIDKWLDKSER